MESGLPHGCSLAVNRSHHPDEPDGVGPGARPFSGRQSFSPSGRAGWSRAVLGCSLAANRSHHPDEPDGVGLPYGCSLAANRSHHPDEPDGVGLADGCSLAANRSHHPDEPDGVGLAARLNEYVLRLSSGGSGILSLGRQPQEIGAEKARQPRRHNTGENSHGNRARLAKATGRGSSP